MIRTRTRDGGGAYLLLDGSRAMVGNLNMDDNNIINCAQLHFASGIGHDVRLGTTVDSLYVQNKAGSAFRAFNAAFGIYQGNAASKWKDAIGNQTFEISPFYDLVNFAGSSKIRMPDLPVADPSDGKSGLWNNGGVLTVGT